MYSRCNEEILYLAITSSILLECVHNVLLQFQTTITTCLKGHKSLFDGLTLDNNMIILIENMLSSLACLYDTLAYIVLYG